MAEMKFICLYRDYLELFRQMTNAQRGKVILAVLEYAFGGEEPRLRGSDQLAFTLLRGQIDRDREKYTQRCQQNRECGKKGGRPKKAEAFAENPAVSEKAKEKEKENEKENVNEKEKEKENEKENEKESVSVCIHPQSKIADGHTHTQLCVEDIKNYCLKQGLTAVDPERFYDYYQSVGWMSGNHRITDWQAALRSWNRQDMEKLTPQKKKEENPYAFLDEQWSC